MTLGELIAELRDAPRATLREGFHKPHSYRGYYDCLAFQPAENVTVEQMLSDAEDSVGRVFHGYKGGDYTMGLYTPVYLAEYGACGEELGHLALKYLLSTATDEAAR